jgi:hypothetical protein
VSAVHCCSLLFTAACRPFAAVRVLKQLTVSDQQLILLKLRMSVTVCVFTVMEVKVNLIRCDIRCDVRE